MSTDGPGSGSPPPPDDPFGPPGSAPPPPPPPTAPPPPPTSPPPPPGGYQPPPAYGGGYGQPSYQAPPQPAYGYPPYGYAAPKTEGTAIGALICAIAAFVVCPIVPAIVALVLASSADKKIAQSNGTLTGEGLTKGARIISWIHLGLAGLALVFLIFLIIVGAASNTDEFNLGVRLLI